MNSQDSNNEYGKSKLSWINSNNLSYKFGKAFAYSFKWLAAIFILLVLLSIYIGTIDAIKSAAELDGAATAYMSAAYHQRCKSRGGCGKNCPFISEDDPRSIILKQLEGARSLIDKIRVGVQEDGELVRDAIAKETTESLKKKIPSICDPAGNDTTFETVLNGIIGVEHQTQRKINEIVNNLKDLEKQYANAETIDVELINAKNRAIILGAAAVAQKNLFVISSIHLNSKIMMNYIANTSQDKRKHVIDMDERERRAHIAAGTNKTSMNSISSIYCDAIALASSLDSAVTAASTGTTTSESIITHMANSLSKVKSSNENVNQCINQLAEVRDLYNVCKNIREAFSNDLPGKISSDNITNLIQNGDYETAIIKSALESDIVSNHKKFAKERSSFEGGGSKHSVRDDDNDVVPWVGLFGKPTYRKTNGSSIEVSSEALKSIPSEYPDQLMRKTSLQLGTKRY